MKLEKKAKKKVKYQQRMSDISLDFFIIKFLIRFSDVCARSKRGMRV